MSTGSFKINGENGTQKFAAPHKGSFCLLCVASTEGFVLSSYWEVRLMLRETNEILYYSAILSRQAAFTICVALIVVNLRRDAVHQRNRLSGLFE